MDVFREHVKERLLAFINAKGMSIRMFEQRCGMSNGYVGMMRKGLSPKMLEKVAKEFPDLNKLWLLYGIGDMDWNEWEPENWIVSENTYASPKHDSTSLKRVGQRIDEICNIKGLQPQVFAEKMDLDYETLGDIIMGAKPATEQLLAKIRSVYPDINPCWLYTGVGKP